SERKAHLLPRARVPVELDDRRGADAPAVRQEPAREVLQVELAVRLAARRARVREPLLGDQPEEPVLRLIAENATRARLPFALPGLLAVRGREDEGRAG